MTHTLEIRTAEELATLGVSARTAAALPRLPQPPAGVQTLIYCDGACSGNGARTASPGGWGAVLLSADKTLVAFDNSPDTTNNKMELCAAIEALRLTAVGASVLVRTDSQYVIKGCTEWRKGWVRNGMRNSKKEPVANADLWHLLWAEVDARRVKLEWVRAHNGDPGNELADELAVCATKRRR